MLLDGQFETTALDVSSRGKTESRLVSIRSAHMWREVCARTVPSESLRTSAPVQATRSSRRRWSGKA